MLAATWENVCEHAAGSRDYWGYDNPANPQPRLVGHMTYDSSARPYLLWCQDSRLSLENLNGPGDEWA